MKRPTHTLNGFIHYGRGVFQISATCAGLVRAGRLESGSASRADFQILGESELKRPQSARSPAGSAHNGTEDKEACAEW